MSFAPIIPDRERWGVDARKFAAYVVPKLTPPQPETPAMPEPQPIPPPDAAAVLPPSTAAEQGAPAMPAGFTAPSAPPAPPPQPDPQAEAAQFADYVGQHGVSLDDNTPLTIQDGQQGPSPPAMPSGSAMPAFGAPAQESPQFQGQSDQSNVGPDAGSPAEQARAFADYVGPQLTAFNRLSQPEQLTAAPAPEPTSGPFAPGGAAADPLGTLGTQLASAAEERHVALHGLPGEEETRRARMAAGGPVFTDEELQRDLARMEPYALALTGEPLAMAGGRVAGAAAGEVARLRLDKFPEGVRDTIRAAAEDAGFWRTQRRGVIPDAQAETMADDLGRSVDQVIAGGTIGRAYSTEETRAVRNAVVAQSVTVNEIAQEIAADPTGAPPRLIAEQVAAGLKLADLTRVAEGARAEAGRSLRAYQAFARDYAADPASAVQRIFRATNLTPDQASAKVAEFTRMTQAGADPFQMAAFWARVERPPPGVVDWFNLVRYNAMLSGPRTLMVNTLGNATEIPWRGLRDVGASVARGRPEELLPEAIGIARGFQRGLGAAMETLRHGVTAEQAIAGDVPRSISSRLDPGLARTVAVTLEAPMRAQQATDELFRQLAYGMALGRQAAIAAGEQGLRGQALLQRADALMAQPTAGMMKTAAAIADRMTYRGELGPIASGLQGVQRIPILGTILLPFLRTIVHITNRGVDRSPLGVIGTGADLLLGRYRGGRIPAGQAPLGERLADNALGSVAFAGLAYLAAQGQISGSGPQDPRTRDLLRAQGWQPYSVKMGDHWVGYQQFGPMAVPLSMAAAWAEAMRYRKPADTGVEAGLDVVRRGAQLLAEQPYLQGVGAIYKGMTEPGRYGEKVVEQTLQTLVPYGAALNTAGQVLDPLERAPGRGQVLGALEARLPGAREGLPPKQDVLGRPLESQQSGVGALFPVRVSADRPEPGLRALLDAGIRVPNPPTAVERIPLTPDEQRVFQRIAGAALSRRLAALRTADPSWEALPLARRRELLHDAVLTARADAATEVVHGIPLAERGRRIQAARPP